MKRCRSVWCLVNLSLRALWTPACKLPLVPFFPEQDKSGAVGDEGDDRESSDEQEQATEPHQAAQVPASAQQCAGKAARSRKKKKKFPKDAVVAPPSAADKLRPEEDDLDRLLHELDISPVRVLQDPPCTRLTNHCTEATTASAECCLQVLMEGGVCSVEGLELSEQAR
jgi:hypothetical protein